VAHSGSSPAAPNWSYSEFEVSLGEIFLKQSPEKMQSLIMSGLWVDRFDSLISKKTDEKWPSQNMSEGSIRSFLGLICTTEKFSWWLTSPSL
jgi:hypothetical protein